MPRAREREEDISERERNLRAYKGITAVSNAASNVRIRHRLHTVPRYLFLVPGMLLSGFSIRRCGLLLLIFERYLYLCNTCLYICMCNILLCVIYMYVCAYIVCIDFSLTYRNRESEILYRNDKREIIYL